MFYSLCLVLYFLTRSFYTDIVIYINLGPWISTDFLNVNWGFMLDRATWFMSLIVVGVSTLVHLYSCNYMAQDPKLTKFLSYLSLFTFFMLLLVTADNLIQLFVGWEGVGLCSYLLINFWFTRIQANKSALKAIFINRIGDTGVLLAILLIFYYFRTFNFHDLFSIVPFFKETTINFLFVQIKVIEVICLLLTIGSLAKSAQLFLHTWLPDAMEGPTPVSALIHAATMVTAGVFLIIRCSFIFEYAPNTLKFISIIGVLTALFGASTALCQNDIKKIVAYSTCSQLGYMFFACGISNYSGSLYHLINHAFFKALLFLTAGAIIHGLVNEQDIRKMGSLLNFFTLSYLFFSLGSLALAGFPFLSGFYSKDFIIESAWSHTSAHSFFCYAILLLSNFFTTAYSVRLAYLVFFTRSNTYKKYINTAHEANIVLAAPLVFLSIGSIFSGYLFRDIFIGSGSDFFSNSILTKFESGSFIENEFIPAVVKNIPSFIFVFAILTVVLYYSQGKNNLLHPYTLKVYSFLNRKYYFDFIYNKLLLYPFLKIIEKNALRHIDKGILEFIGPSGVFNFIIWNIRLQKKLQKGYIFNYICYILISVSLIIVLLDVMT